MDPTELPGLLADIDARLAAVTEEARPLVVGAAVGYAIARIQQWEDAAARERALSAILAAACEALDGAPAGSSTGTDPPADGWAAAFFEQAQRAVMTAPVLLPGGGTATLGSHRYDVLRAEARLEEPGLAALVLSVQLTNDSQYDANFWTRTFRLQHGDQASAPTNDLNEVVPGRTTRTANVEFTVPAQIVEATLLVGDDAATAVALPLIFPPLA